LFHAGDYGNKSPEMKEILMRRPPLRLEVLMEILQCPLDLFKFSEDTIFHESKGQGSSVEDPRKFYKENYKQLAALIEEVGAFVQQANENWIILGEFNVRSELHYCQSQWDIAARMIVTPLEKWRSHDYVAASALEELIQMTSSYLTHLIAKYESCLPGELSQDQISKLRAAENDRGIPSNRKITGLRRGILQCIDWIA
jgi:hypothetical protein